MVSKIAKAVVLGLITIIVVANLIASMLSPTLESMDKAQQTVANQSDASVSGLAGLYGIAKIILVIGFAMMFIIIVFAITKL